MANSQSLMPAGVVDGRPCRTLFLRVMEQGDATSLDARTEPREHAHGNYRRGLEGVTWGNPTDESTGERPVTIPTRNSQARHRTKRRLATRGLEEVGSSSRLRCGVIMRACSSIRTRHIRSILSTCLRTTIRMYVSSPWLERFAYTAVGRNNNVPIMPL